MGRGLPARSCRRGGMRARAGIEHVEKYPKLSLLLSAPPTRQAQPEGSRKADGGVPRAGGDEQRGDLGVGGYSGRKRVCPISQMRHKCSTLGGVRDLPGVTQPDLVTPQSSLVAPGVATAETPAKRDQLGQLSTLEGWWGWRAIQKRG